MLALAIAVMLLVALGPAAGADTPRRDGTSRDALRIAQRRELDPTRRREIVHATQRDLADKAYYVIAHPASGKGFKQIIGQSLGSRLTRVWLER